MDSQSESSPNPEDVPPQFKLEQIKLAGMNVDVSASARLAEVLPGRDLDQVTVGISQEIRRLSAERHELELHINVKAVLDGEVVFQAEVREVGTFCTRGYADGAASDQLSTRGVATMFPFIQEFIHSVAGRCGVASLCVPPLLIE